MPCRICEHPNRITNDRTVHEAWWSAGTRAQAHDEISRQSNAYDADCFVQNRYNAARPFVPYPCGFCVPDAFSAPAPRRPDGPDEAERRRQMERNNYLFHCGIESLKNKGLDAPKAISSTDIEDVVMSLTQQSKLQAACLREGVQQVKQCVSDLTMTDAAKAAGAAAMIAAAKGLRVTPRGVVVDFAAAGGSASAQHQSCIDAAKALVGDACMKRAMPEGFIHIKTELKD